MQFSLVPSGPRVSPLLSTFALGAALSACGPGGDGMDGDPEPDAEPEDTCTEENHCVRDDDGMALCEDGFEWEDPDDEENLACVEVPGLDLLGNETHDIESLEVTVILDGEYGASTLRDLAFNPAAPHELWILSQGQTQGDSSTIVIDDPGTDDQAGMSYQSQGNQHFLARPAALAFAGYTDPDHELAGFFATAHDEDEETQGPVQFGGSPADFMGPTLWTADRFIFDAGHGGHMDMLHNSPNGVGCAWETENVYWIYDGYHNALVRYDFGGDHGPGGTDHSDATIARYVEGEVGYAPDVSSHLAFDAESNLLYAADTANNRIVALDVTTGEVSHNTWPNYDGGPQYAVEGAELSTVIDGADVDGLEAPSGLELHDGHLWISDNETGRIFAFDLEGNLVDWVDTELPAGALMGLAFNEAGDLYLVDAPANRVLRIRPGAE